MEKKSTNAVIRTGFGHDRRENEALERIKEGLMFYSITQGKDFGGLIDGFLSAVDLLNECVIDSHSMGRLSRLMRNIVAVTDFAKEGLEVLLQDINSRVAENRNNSFYGIAGEGYTEKIFELGDRFSALYDSASKAYRGLDRAVDQFKEREARAESYATKAFFSVMALFNLLDMRMTDDISQQYFDSYLREPLEKLMRAADLYNDAKKAMLDGLDGKADENPRAATYIAIEYSRTHMAVFKTGLDTLGPSLHKYAGGLEKSFNEMLQEDANFNKGLITKLYRYGDSISAKRIRMMDMISPFAGAASASSAYFAYAFAVDHNILGAAVLGPIAFANAVLLFFNLSEASRLKRMLRKEENSANADTDINMDK